MLDTRGYGKVCDMGLARFVVGKTNTQDRRAGFSPLPQTLNPIEPHSLADGFSGQAGTPDYMAPEMIDPPHYHDNSADWWSLGVLMYVARRIHRGS